MTNELHRLCAASDVAQGEILGASLPDGTRLAVYRVDGEIYVTDDRCSHGDASLSEEGSLDGFLVECSWHFGSFDVRTGQPVAHPCTEPIRTYVVRLIAADVFVETQAVVPIKACGEP